MTATITWLPAADAIEQAVQYKLGSAIAWTTDPTVLTGSANTLTIIDLLDNLIYDFRVITYCLTGTPSTGNASSNINMICPTVTRVITDTTISYNFTALGGSVTSYVIDLLDSGGSTILQSKTTISGIFTGLTPLTTYSIRVKTHASTFIKTCPNILSSTIATPTCSVPTGVTAILS
jgi:hypothetical protein